MSARSPAIVLRQGTGHVCPDIEIPAKGTCDGRPGRPPPGASQVVNSPAVAPRAAYLLTAAMADNTRQAGVIVPGDGMSAEWGGYDESAQRDILAAVAEQTRLVLKMLHDTLGAEIEMDWDDTARAVCSEAFAAARQLVRPEPGAWSLPECAHCREVIARAMCSLQIQAYFRLGLRPGVIAAMCRQSAGEPRTFPGQ
jgi:hypothetical protein